MSLQSKKSIDEIILALPKSEQAIMKRLRVLILECLLGFCQGNLFANDDGALLTEGRKQCIACISKP